MFFGSICVVIFASSVLSRNVPNFVDLDEEEKMLFRAAYDSYDAPYNNEAPYSYDSYENEIPVNKLDLLKDGLWALKAKMKELKAFNKALAANMLLTKLQVKELMANHLKPLKNHQHIEPIHNYQPPSYSQYEQSHQQKGSPVLNHQAAAPKYTAQHFGSPPTPHDPYYGH